MIYVTRILGSSQCLENFNRPLSRRLDCCDRMIQNESRDPFGGNLYYVAMQITFLSRKFRNVERNLHCDVVHITTKWVSSLTLDCNGVFRDKGLLHVLFNVFTPWVSSYHNNVFALLIHFMQFCIWTNRNLCKFELHKVTHLVIIFFMNLISSRIKADFTRLDRSEFSNYWGTDNAVYCVTGNSNKSHPP